jgi:hypothetical protein
MSRPPLEEFVRDYVETIGGAWDEVEPQVYDVLLPRANTDRQWQGESLRLTFDPEAVPEHPGCQLASHGTPLVETLLGDAIEHARFAELYFLGLNLAPHELPSRVRRNLQLRPGVEWQVERMRALHFPQAFLWFQATFVSDQKEQEIVAIALDLHYGRVVRHRDKLLDHSRLAEIPALPLPEASRLSLAAAYPMARAEVLNTLTTLANARDRELRERLTRQAARMQRYYRDLRDELSGSRAKENDEAQARLAARKLAIEREERLRVAELHQKNSLRVSLRLLNTLVIQQPKLLVAGRLSAAKFPSAALDMVWDPLTEALEAVLCPTCARPSFVLDLTRTGTIRCDHCAGSALRG